MSQSKKNQHELEISSHRTLISPSAALEVSSAMTKKRYLISLILTAITLGLLLLLSGASFCVRVECHRRFITVFGDLVAADNKNNIIRISHRKLLVPETVKQPDRIWGEKRCSKSDLLIYQGPTDPLPNGIPTYTVEIMNACITKDCHISHIHLNCGWFSSACLIDPRVFKRLSFDNCLVKNGKPLINGDSISFQYANTFPYHLSISSVHC